MIPYHAPAWLPGGQLQTLWPALRARRVVGTRVAYRRERWATPDGDFVDVDFLAQAPRAAPFVVLFHGLEGASRSHYAEAFAGWARGRGMGLAVPHFRGCSGEINHAPRAYHSGDVAEIGWMLGQVRARLDADPATRGQPLLAVGVSLGGNALLRWAGEAGSAAAHSVSAVASVCAPLDLAAGARAIGHGFNRQIYTRMFLRTMKAKAAAKLAQHPGLFDATRLRGARDLFAFDDLFTAPLHGFAGVEDYYRRASAKPLLADIRVPALALNALNDPFVPAASLPHVGEIGRHVTLWQPRQGGHVGFAEGALPPGHVFWLPRAVGGWLLTRAPGQLPDAAWPSAR